MDTTQVRAIETRYKGYRFRSRLEARWAVFFDALGIKWEYEVEGFYLGKLGKYLPDFWLPQVNMFAEVKPKEFASIEIARCQALTKTTGYPCLMLDGVPEATNYWATEYWRRGCEIYFMDYVMGEGHMYHLDENRFYCSTGNAYPDKEDCSGEDNLVRAVNAARSARFEHGESGA